MILLDTCTLIWLSTNSPELSLSARKAIDTAGDSLFVSPITIFEIGQKHGSGKLCLPQPIDAWFKAVFRRYDLVEAAFTSEIAATAWLLPPLHKDPFDRLIIATTMVNKLILLTPDQHIRQYPGVATMW